MFITVFVPSDDKAPPIHIFGQLCFNYTIVPRFSLQSLMLIAHAAMIYRIARSTKSRLGNMLRAGGLNYSEVKDILSKKPASMRVMQKGFTHLLLALSSPPRHLFLNGIKVWICQVCVQYALHLVSFRSALGSSLSQNKKTHFSRINWHMIIFKQPVF